MTISKEDFIKKYKESPKTIQDWMGDDVVTETIADFERTHGLHKDQRRALADIVGEILMGILHPKDFVPSLKEQLGVNDEVARVIAYEVNEKIFAPVKDLLVEMHGFAEKRDVANPTPTPQPTTASNTIYKTAPGLFEQKLKHTVIAHPPLNQEETPEKHSPEITSSHDSYREPPV